MAEILDINEVRIMAKDTALKKVFATLTPRRTIQTAVADEGNLKYSVGLENCTKLWFYEE